MILMLIFLSALSVLLMPAIGVQAATIPVNCPADSLASAIALASPGDTLQISGTCVGNFVVDRNLTLQGSPTATLDGGKAGTVLTINSGVTATVDSLTISGGKGMEGAHGTDGDSPGPGGAGQAGGITNNGTLTLTNSTVSHNTGGNGGAGGNFPFGAAQNGASGGPGGGAGSGGIVNFGALTIFNSSVSHNNGGHGGGGGHSYHVGGVGGAGGTGGITNFGSLTLGNSTVSSNIAGNTGPGGALYGNANAKAAGSPGASGGIFNSGTMTVQSSTVSVNTGGAGGDGSPQYQNQPYGLVGGSGGLYNNGAASLTNSTISGNFGGAGGVASSVCIDEQRAASGGAGGVGGLSSSGNLDVTAVTISHNTGGAGGRGGDPVFSIEGVRCFFPGNRGTGGNGGVGGSLTMIGSIIAHNHPGNAVSCSGCSFGPVGGPDCRGATITSNGYNLLGVANGCDFATSSETDLKGTEADPLNPKLDPLAKNGGPTGTMALRPDSPAIDKIPPSNQDACPATDQRGVTRPQSSACDIGAFELAP